MVFLRAAAEPGYVGLGAPETTHGAAAKEAGPGPRGQTSTSSRSRAQARARVSWTERNGLRCVRAVKRGVIRPRGNQGDPDADRGWGRPWSQHHSVQGRAGSDAGGGSQHSGGRWVAGAAAGGAFPHRPVAARGVGPGRRRDSPVGHCKHAAHLRAVGEAADASSQLWVRAAGQRCLRSHAASARVANVTWALDLPSVCTQPVFKPGTHRGARCSVHKPRQPCCGGGHRQRCQALPVCCL